MSFIRSEKSAELHTLEYGTVFVKSIKGLPGLKIYKLGSPYCYSSFSFFLCENLRTFDTELFRDSCLVFPLTFPRKYPPLSCFLNKYSISYTRGNLFIIDNYISSLPTDYLESNDGLHFLTDYRTYLVGYSVYLDINSNFVSDGLKKLGEKFNLA
ncbi:hypothetical protein PL373_17510 [Tenacibaculum maritimum]|nr:hypothetical protein [Tenacibaculum maritimum]MDB0602896.1 hypothetical protein [Tenacibaculum maritimum]MDB0611362.1 hypothetical protein [Tenacibaculum maritimum]